MGFPSSHSQWNQAKQQVTLGKLAGLGILGVGDVHIIKALDDTDGPRFGEQFGPKTSIFQTFTEVTPRLRTNAHDYVLVWPDPDGVAYGDELDWTFDFIHLIGVVQGTRRPGIDQLTIDGDGVEVANIRFQAQTASTDTFSLKLDTACLGAYVHGCHVLPPLLAGATSDVVDAGKRTLFENCLFGQLSSHVPNTSVAQAAGALTARFERCTFMHKAAAITDTFAVLVAASGINIFRDCIFHNGAFAATVMTEGVTAVATGEAMFDHCSMSGVVIFATTALSHVAPGGCGKTVATGNAFNPALTIDGAVLEAVDTP